MKTGKKRVRAGLAGLLTITMLLGLVGLTLGLCGCNVTLAEPEETLTNFFDGLKTKDEDALVFYAENEDIHMLIHSSGDKKQLNKLYDSVFQNFSYRILSVDKNGENGRETKATAKVEVSNADFSKVLEQYKKTSYAYMQANLYAGLSEKTLNAKCLELFVKQVRKAAKKADMNTETLTIHLTKNENYSWDMELTEEMMNVILGGLIIPL
ncbi:MAG: hypothetical protein HFE76_05745 [Firmicutes bacterium]|nr:hypothetical protein [Bacillota bacterium]